MTLSQILRAHGWFITHTETFHQGSKLKTRCFAAPPSSNPSNLAPEDIPREHWIPGGDALYTIYEAMGMPKQRASAHDSAEATHASPEDYAENEINHYS